MPTDRLKMYYDGLCHLCSREVVHYQKIAGSEKIDFIDITSPKFDAVSEGLDPVRVHREMHVRRLDGTLAVGVDAFIAVWEVLPRYHGLARISRRPLPKAILGVGYAAFARIRPFLPKRSAASCEASPYCDTHSSGGSNRE